MKSGPQNLVPRVVFLLVFTAVAIVPRGAQAIAQDVQQPASVRAQIRGIVHDEAGKPAVGATVFIEQRNGNRVAETTSGPDGKFAIAGLAPGDYSVRAELRESASVASPVTIPSASELHVDLLLHAPAHAGSSSPKAQEMEFSDAPNFSIAAVTDWTAAGGHGSDSILRTSESLTRDTVTLKPQAGLAGHGANSSEDATVEAELRANVAAHADSADANKKLGDYYLHHGRYKEALANLETAHRAAPNDTVVEYELALTLQGAGDFQKAREHVRSLLATEPTGDLLRLDGELDEQLGDPLSAVHQLEQAVHEDPSEENYFQWGSELLLHRAIWQAKDVFSVGAKRYPHSERMLTALGSSLFACALYEEAAARLCEAANLNPGVTEPYIFLGKIEIASPNPLACVKPKLQEFSTRQPANPLASYYLAMAIWKESGPTPDGQTLQRVEGLLKNAVSLDGQCSDAYLQLGNLYTARRDNATAVDYYTKAIHANPQLSEAHYRLGMALDRMGRRDEARREFELHEQIEKQQAAAVERQRREIKQFLVVQDKPAEPRTTP